MATQHGCQVWEEPAVADRPERHASASDLLATWRAAERDTVAAHTAASVATLALRAAQAAEAAATAVAEAVSSAAESLEGARSEAQRAKTAAREAAEAAEVAFASAEGDDVRAGVELQEAEATESAARDAYRQAQREGFPKG